MNFFADYFAVIDVVAVLALIGLAIAAVVRQGSIWMGVLTAAVAVWATVRFFSLI